MGGGLGKRGDCGDARYAGVEVAFSSDIVETLEVTPHACPTCAASRPPPLAAAAAHAPQPPLPHSP